MGARKLSVWSRCSDGGHPELNVEAVAMINDAREDASVENQEQQISGNGLTSDFVVVGLT